MFPLYRLGFTPLWNSYRIGLLFPFKTNNSAQFLYQIAFTTQHFWKWYKICQIGFTTAWKHAEVWWKSLIGWFSVKCGSIHVKIGNISKNLNLIERLNKSSKCFEELYHFFIMSGVEQRAIIVSSNFQLMMFQLIFPNHPYIHKDKHFFATINLLLLWLENLYVLKNLSFNFSSNFCC